MISDREWIRRIGQWEDWEDESYGNKLLMEYMRLYDNVRFYKALRKMIGERKKNDCNT